MNEINEQHMKSDSNISVNGLVFWILSLLLLSLTIYVWKLILT